MRLALTILRQGFAVLAVLGLSALILEVSWASVDGLHSHISMGADGVVADEHHDGRAGARDYSHCPVSISAEEPGGGAFYHGDGLGNGASGSGSCDLVNHHWLFGAPSVVAKPVSYASGRFELCAAHRPAAHRLRPAGDPPKI